MAASSVKILGTIVVILLLVQLVRPGLTKRPATPAEFQAPAEVKQIFQQSCYACHSNEPRLSWFDQIVPVYWLVARDVHKARQRLNFSELGAQAPASRRAALFQSVNSIQAGAMPLPSYLRLHPEAVVTARQMAVLREYLLPKEPLSVTESAMQASDREYHNWIVDGGKPVRVQASPNGIEFIPAYKNWKVIDSTDRFDGNSLRIILGNAVAVKAIALHNINPWPDGTTFAKVGWSQQPDGRGAVQAGAFLKIGFMIKDKVKYASTAGWGWAEWEGTQLKPYGNGPGFSSECVACHTPMRKNDYVFTMPIESVRRPIVSDVGTPNNRAALLGKLPVNPLEWSVITCGTNPRESTIWTLFGNDIAIQYSRRHAEGQYPSGSKLALVTWQQQEDSRWFGARMPAETRTMELVTVSGADNSYLEYEGSPFRKAAAAKVTERARIAYLLSQRAAVMP